MLLAAMPGWGVAILVISIVVFILLLIVICNIRVVRQTEK